MFNPINEFANWPSAPNHFIFRLLQCLIKWKQIQGWLAMRLKAFRSRPAGGSVFHRANEELRLSPNDFSPNPALPVPAVPPAGQARRQGAGAGAPAPALGSAGTSHCSPHTV